MLNNCAPCALHDTLHCTPCANGRAIGGASGAVAMPCDARLNSGVRRACRLQAGLVEARHAAEVERLMVSERVGGWVSE